MLARFFAIRASMSCILWEWASGDPTLQPEDGIGFDTSMTIKSPLDMPFTLQITWFRQRYDRIILFVPIDAYRIQASDRFSAQNDGLETQLSIGRSTWLTLAHTFQRPRFLGQNSMPLPLRPSHIGHLRLTAPWGDTIDPTLVCSILNDCRPFWGTPVARLFND